MSLFSLSSDYFWRRMSCPSFRLPRPCTSTRPSRKHSKIDLAGIASPTPLSGSMPVCRRSSAHRRVWRPATTVKRARSASWPRPVAFRPSSADITTTSCGGQVHVPARYSLPSDFRLLTFSTRMPTSRLPPSRGARTAWTLRKTCPSSSCPTRGCRTSSSSGLRSSTTNERINYYCHPAENERNIQILLRLILNGETSLPGNLGAMSREERLAFSNQRNQSYVNAHHDDSMETLFADLAAARQETLNLLEQFTDEQLAAHASISFAADRTAGDLFAANAQHAAVHITWIEEGFRQGL